jgi:hypothetical protein
MDPVKAGAVVGERKAVTSVRSHSGQIAAARFEALIRKLAKRLSGSREARRLAVRNAVLSTVHAGGELGCEGGLPFDVERG